MIAQLSINVAKYLFHKDGIDPKKDRDLPWVALNYKAGGKTFRVFCFVLACSSREALKWKRALQREARNEVSAGMTGELGRSIFGVWNDCLLI